MYVVDPHNVLNDLFQGGTEEVENATFKTTEL